MPSWGSHRPSPLSRQGGGLDVDIPLQAALGFFVGAMKHEAIVQGLRIPGKLRLPPDHGSKRPLSASTLDVLQAVVTAEAIGSERAGAKPGRPSRQTSDKSNHQKLAGERIPPPQERISIVVAIIPGGPTTGNAMGPISESAVVRRTPLGRGGGSLFEPNKSPQVAKRKFGEGTVD